MCVSPLLWLCEGVCCSSNAATLFSSTGVQRGGVSPVAWSASRCSCSVLPAQCTITSAEELYGLAGAGCPPFLDMFVTASPERYFTRCVKF